MRASRWIGFCAAGVAFAAPALATVLPAEAAPQVHSTHHATVRGDFDGDGRPDLVAGAPGGERVRVAYTSATFGVSHTQWLTEPDTSAFHSSFGSALAVGDFDGDGFVDLAVGDPGFYDPSDDVQRGVVFIYTGSSSGLIYSGTEILGPDEFDNDNELGAALAAGDVDGDGFVDLVIGNPGPGGGSDEAGSILLFRGSSTGLDTSVTDAAVSSHPAIEGRFGAAVAVGDVNRDGFKDVIVGEPGGYPHAEPSNPAHVPGDIQVILGSGGGLGTHRRTIYGTAIHNLTGNLGSSVAAGDINRDGRADVVAGAPNAAVGGHPGAGKVVVFTGGHHGLSASRAKTLSQSSPHIPGRALAGDQFGSAVSAADLTGDRRADVAIGVPGARVAGAHRAGLVYLLHGTSHGVTTAGARLVSQATRHVPGLPVRRAAFGSAVASIGASTTKRDLLIGIPGHSGGQVLRLRGGRHLFTTRHARIVTDPTPHDQLGASLPG